MATYLLQVAYTPQAIAAMIANPQDRVASLKPIFRKLGGKMNQAWFTFGEYDIAGVMELPDNVSAAAFSFAISAGGAIKSVKTTPMMTVAEGIEALGKAAGLPYQPPK